jgi:hypothetical protein
LYGTRASTSIRSDVYGLVYFLPFYFRPRVR